MRMIEPDHLEIAAPRISFALHQLFRRDQKTIAFRALFSRVRDRISLGDDLAVIAESAEQQPPTLVRIITHTVFANLVQLSFSDSDHSACSTSAITSSILSMPTEIRTNPSVIPNSARRAGVRSRCDALAACSTPVKTSPKLVERTHNCNASIKRNAASRVCSFNSMDTSAP